MYKATCDEKDAQYLLNCIRLGGGVAVWCDDTGAPQQLGPVHSPRGKPMTWSGKLPNKVITKACEIQVTFSEGHMPLSEWAEKNDPDPPPAQAAALMAA